MSKNKIKVGIVGGTGYTGVELLRLLANHPNFIIDIITSRSDSGIKIADKFPNLKGIYNLSFSEPNIDNLKNCEAVFFATPHGVAMKMAPELIKNNVKIIDLSADFRISDLNVWEKWYGMKHESAKLMKSVVYGLPEINRNKIRKSSIIANPGCYPTAIILGLYPLLKENLIETGNLIADAKSGISGAGNAANAAYLAAETSESFQTYGINGHRHYPEIKQQLETMSKTKINLTFTPHLVPMIRGMETTLYPKLKENISLKDVQSIYEKTYADDFFVDVLTSGTPTNTKTVKGSNMCRIAIYEPQKNNQIVISSIIDNLVKGASGQAIQNLNILFGLKENSGLKHVPLVP